MPLSMRRQTARLKNRTQRRLTEKAKREQAVELLKQAKKARVVASACTLSRSTAYRLYAALKNKHTAKLNRLLNPVVHFPGRPTTLTKSEEDAIVERTLFAASRGFALDVKNMRTLMGAVASDGRVGYKRGIPSEDALRSFRARNRELTFCSAEDMCHKQFEGESVEHVQTRSLALSELQKEEPHLFKDPQRIWNLEETAVSAQHGKNVKVFSSSKTHHPKRRHDLKDNGKHFTAVIMASVSGKVAPPFLIVAGKKGMPNWMKAMEQKVLRLLPAKYEWLGYNNWVPKGTKIICTPKGSMDAHTLKHLVKHFAEFLRQFLPDSKSVLVLLDGYSSRKGTEWVEECMKFNIHAIQLPANTSQFLRPCDFHINKHFKQESREIRDQLLLTGDFSHANMSFKMKLAMAGYRAITRKIVNKSFIDVGLWPLSNAFVDKLRDKVQRRLEGKTMSTESRSQKVRRFARLRCTDKAICSDLRRVLAEPEDQTIAVTSVENILQRNRTSNRVLWESAPLRAPVRVIKFNGSKIGQTPAMWLTKNKGSPNVRAEDLSSGKKLKIRTKRLRNALKEFLPVCGSKRPCFPFSRARRMTLSRFVRLYDGAVQWRGVISTKVFAKRENKKLEDQIVCDCLASCRGGNGGRLAASSQINPFAACDSIVSH